MSDDAIKAAEKRAYQNGYNAGRKRLEADLRSEDAYKEKCEFYDRAFLAALPAALATSWTRGEKRMTTVQDRVEIAWEAAGAALKKRRYP